MRTIKKYLQLFQQITLVVSVIVVVLALFGALASKSPIKPQSQEDMALQKKELYTLAQKMQKKDPKLYSYISQSFCFTLGELCELNQASSKNKIENSLVQKVANLLALPYANPPASGIFFFTDSIARAGLIPKTYAAEGIGFAAIRPFMNIWKMFRDIAYLILVVILIIIGFMIMFRMKLDAQTVISVENALPRIIIALILITFSFAIAGFLIDLMYISIIIIIAIMGARGNIPNIPELQSHFVNAPAGMIIPLNDLKMNLRDLGDLANSFINILPLWANQIVRLFTAYVASLFVLGLGLRIAAVDGGGDITFMPVMIIKIIIISVLTGVAFSIGYSVLIPFILALAIIATLIFLMFKIFFMLLVSYIKILLFIMFAPIILLIEAIPGKSIFSKWFGGILVELMTFPLVVLFLLLSKMLIDLRSAPGMMWRPPFLTDINPNSFIIIVGAFVLFAIPQLITAIKAALGVQGGLGGIGPGVFFGGAAIIGGGIMGGLTKFQAFGQLPFIGSAAEKLAGSIGIQSPAIGSDSKTWSMRQKIGHELFPAKSSEIAKYNAEMNAEAVAKAVQAALHPQGAANQPPTDTS